MHKCLNTICPHTASLYHTHDTIFQPVDLWIKKHMILCPHSTLRSSEQSTKHKSRSKTCYRFVYSAVKIIRLCEYRIWQTFFGDIHQVYKGMPFFFLIVLFRCWFKTGQANSDHMEAYEYVLINNLYLLLLRYLAQFIVIHFSYYKYTEVLLVIYSLIVFIQSGIVLHTMYYRTRSGI